jgi:hypothetical protein
MEYLKSVKLQYDNSDYQYYLFIYDELRHVKTFLPSNDKDNKRVLILNHDYYVNKDFIQENPFYKITNGMLYRGFQASICQEKGEEKEELAF